MTSIQTIISYTKEKFLFDFINITQNFPHYLYKKFLHEKNMTAISIIIGAFLVYYQLKKQHQHNINLKQKDIKLNLYKDAVKEINEAQAQFSSLSATCNVILIHIDMFWANFTQHRIVTRNIKYINDINNDAHIALMSFSKATTSLENYDIILKDIIPLRNYLSHEHRLLIKSLINIIQKLIPYYPANIEVAEYLASSEKIRPPSDEDKKKLQEIMNDFKNVVYDISSHLYDIVIELQNQLLGEYFNNNIEPRDSNNDTLIVLHTGESNLMKIRALNAENKKGLDRFFLD